MLAPATSRVRDLLIGTAVVFLVMSPGLFLDRAFGVDVTNHAWLIWVQGEAIRNTGHPTLFMSTLTQGVFEPYFGFYGGTLYAFAGAISAVLGPQAAYTGASAIFAAMAYRGMWLTARIAGARPLPAHLPAFVFVTSAYYLTDLYARGAWTEYAALSGFALALGYGLALLRGPWTGGSVAGFAFGTVIATGSHNITLLWGAILVIVVGGIAYLVAGATRPSVGRVARLFVFTLLCVGVNFWFLALDLLHASDTNIAHIPFNWGSTSGFDWLSNTLTLFRTTPESSGTFGLTVTAPLLALLGGLWLRRVSDPLATPSARSRRRLMFVALAGVVVLVLLVRMPERGWDFLGSPFTLIQFPFRLAGWITLGTAIVFALCIGLVGAHPAATRGRLRLLAGIFVVITLAQTVHQLYPSTDSPIVNRNRDEAFTNGPLKEPKSWYDGGSYRDHSLTMINADPNRRIWFGLPKPGQTTVHQVADAPEGAGPILTNIAGGPYVVRFDGQGFHIAGHDSGGFIVIQRNPGSVGPLDITVRGDGGLPQTLSGAISVASLLLIVLSVLVLGLRGRRARRRPVGAAGEPQEPALRPHDDAPGDVTPVGAV